jgi:hypothetical protein
VTGERPATTRFSEHHASAQGDFKELDEALSAMKGALPAAYAIGLIYGSVCAPHLVPPSVYLPEILGRKMELPDPTVASRVLSLLHSLHNQLAEMVEDNKLLYIRRKRVTRDKEGLFQLASDHWREVFGFRKGLSFGTESEEDFSEAALRAYDRLVAEWDPIRSMIRRIDAKRKPYTAKESEFLHHDLVEQGKRTARIMRSIAHSLYLQRVNKYKAQGVVRIGRNDPCPCGSGKKFKQCCMDKMKLSNAENS